MNVAATTKVVERELQLFKRLWRGYAFSTFLSPILYLAAMGVGLGDLIDENTASVGGLSYLDFVAPGLLVASAVQLAAPESLWPVMGGMKWMGQFHGMVATPITPADVYTGFVAWTVLRTVAGSAVFLVTAAFLGGVPSGWGVVAILAAGLTAAAFSAVFAAYAATCRDDQSFPLIMRVVILPLFLFSGTFFPVEQLPDALEALAFLSPLWHGVEFARSATTGDFDAVVVINVLVLVACIIGGYAWGIRSFAKRLAP
ncbi:MAG: ABC transporter permease [Actinomycetota bacterium]